MSALSRRVCQLALIVASFAVSACGPFGYLGRVARDANRAVAEAKAAGAETYAPYEYWGAVSYLEQAKVMMAYSEYERSFDYGARARQLADEAKKKAQMREAGQTEKSAPGIARPSDEVKPTEPASATPPAAAEPAPATPAAEPPAAAEPKSDASKPAAPKAKSKKKAGGKAEGKAGSKAGGEP